MPEELWMEVYDIVQEAVIKTISKKKKWERAKWLSEEALQITEKRIEAKGKEEKETYIHLNAEFQRIAGRDRKAFLSDQYKEIEENNRMRNTRDLFKKKTKQKNPSPRLISYRMDWLDLPEVQETLKSLFQHHNSKASILEFQSTDMNNC